MKRFLLSLVGFVAIATIATAIVTTPDAQAQASAEYSCGTYGTGNYSTGNNCSNNNNVGAPNTGFTALMQPAVAVPIGLSLLALIAGVLLLVRRRKRITLGGHR
jgi:hypothetical protein